MFSGIESNLRTRTLGLEILKQQASLNFGEAVLPGAAAVLVI